LDSVRGMNIHASLFLFKFTKVGRVEHFHAFNFYHLPALFSIIPLVLAQADAESRHEGILTPKNLGQMSNQTWNLLNQTKQKWEGKG
jgi:hypothetical protein